MPTFGWFVIRVASICLLAVAVTAATSDWPQWRGPLRNGVALNSPPLADSWPADGPKLLWESEKIPGNDDGGHGSPVVAEGRVYLSLVWHSEVPSETRTIHELVMRELGYQGTGGLGKPLVEKIEAQRVAINPQLRGKKLEEFLDQWVDANLDNKQKQLYGGWVRSRFKKGRFAIPLEDYEKLLKVQDKPFESDAAFRRWLNEQGFSDFVKDEVIKAVPPTKQVAEDTVICLDLETGKTLWNAQAPGEPKGRNCSSTAAVVDGKVYAMGSTQLFCADGGKIVWSAPLPSKAPGSSPLVSDGIVVINVNKLTAFDAATGKQRWQKDKIGGGFSSPVLWRDGPRPIVIINARNEVTAVDLKSGDVLWQTPGGGDSTPAIAGDMLAVQSKDPKLGLMVLNLRSTGAEPLWKFPMDGVRSQASPIIHDGCVYHTEDGSQFCFDLGTGALKWKQAAQCSISSPTLADGKIFVMLNSGNNLQMLKATPQERIELGKANVRALWCPSPTIAQGRLILRAQDRLRCYDLRASEKLSASKN